MNLNHVKRAFLCALALGFTSLVGCRSGTEPGSMSHASFQIRGPSLADIQQATAAVFQEENHALASATSEEMGFDRPGSRRDPAKWGGLASGGVTMRVKVGVTEMLNGGYLLQADSYAVQNSDDPFFRTESRNVLLNHRPNPKNPGQGGKAAQIAVPTRSIAAPHPSETAGRRNA